jgi:hypothetical protein
MKPSRTIGVTDRTKLKELVFEKSAAVTPSRFLCCRGRKVLGYGNVDELWNVFIIPKATDTIVLSSDDYSDVKEWLG